jgi:hypothetical protein
MNSLTENPLFGHTLGASGPSLMFLSEIKKLVVDRTGFIDPLYTEERGLAVLFRLQQYHSGLKLELDDLGSNDYISLEREEAECLAKKLHVFAFSSAVLIYFHQSLRDTVPQDLALHVSEVLEGIEAFIVLGGIHFTLWPVFIAAVEVYENKDIDCIRKLFSRVSGIGVGNRHQAFSLLEEIWRIREATSVETGLPTGMIKLDWRQMMHDSGMDILLV